MPQEPLILHRENGKIEYHELNGKLWYSYRAEEDLPTRVHQRRYRVYKAQGTIPDDVIAQGKDAVKEFAERRVQEKIGKDKEKHQALDAFLKNPDFPVEVEYQGITLKGKIISADDTTLRVQLDEPYQGQEYVIYGYASAIAGHHILDDTGSFSENAIQSARGLLIRIYNQERNRKENAELIKLADELNSSNGDTTST